MNRSVSDGLNFLSKLTLKRSVNAAKVWSSYYIARALRKPIHWGMPISISIEPTTSCNLRCPECPSGLRSFTRPTGMLDEDIFIKAIDELSPHTTYLILYFQGEPYLNKKFFDYVGYAHSKKLYTATSTNAHYLNDEIARKTVESGLDRLIISIDGTTQDTYEQYRIGGSLDKVLEGARNIVKWKKELKSKTPHLIFQMVVFSTNEYQIPELYRLAKEIGVDEVGLKTAQVYDYENGNKLLPQQEKYSRYRKNSNGKYALKNKMLNQCWRLWSGAVITWDGSVVPCCFDKDAQHNLGSMDTKGFKAVWRNTAYTNFRNALLKSRSEIEICKNCSEGTKVWNEE
jgi:radical SAM protein with 4Fe4S-binding SPASM domain